MPGERSRHQHTAKANRMARSTSRKAPAKKAATKRARSESPGATVHKEMPNGTPTRNHPRR